MFPTYTSPLYMDKWTHDAGEVTSTKDHGLRKLSMLSLYHITAYMWSTDGMVLHISPPTSSLLVSTGFRL